jgi:hypothetical protein
VKDFALGADEGKEKEKKDSAEPGKSRHSSSSSFSLPFARISSPSPCL